MPKSEENCRGLTKEEDDLYFEALKTGGDVGKIYAMARERRQRERDEELKEQWPTSEGAKLFAQLNEAFTACQRLVDENPDVQRAAELVAGERQDIYTMLLENLDKANRAPRCDYQKTDGNFCRAPKMRGQNYCCMHVAMEAARPKKFSLPALDDANAIQVAITKGAQGLVDGTLEEKRATRLGYYLQLAMNNVNNVNFEPEEEFEEEYEAEEYEAEE